MIDALFQNLMPVQSSQQPKPPTVASATSVVIENFLTIITGTVAIATIPAPVGGTTMIVLVFTNANPGGVTTGGNIRSAVDPAQYAPVILFWDPVSALWYPGKLALG